MAKRSSIDKQILKDLIYGCIKELGQNQDFYYHSNFGSKYNLMHQIDYFERLYHRLSLIVEGGFHNRYTITNNELSNLFKKENIRKKEITFYDFNNSVNCVNFKNRSKQINYFELLKEIQLHHKKI